ncbi:GNAT family N-acetyltransferase [Cohnella sp.]|uniref:GNAT family N-acetyltransferase n=1 Tax=Cohnella sp. TaxID=1883426 RepID=UPI003563FD2F
MYQYDFSEFEPADVNENGLYEYMYLDHYWTEESRHPFFIRVNDKLAGFALVREIGNNEQEYKVFWMAEFFIMKKYRKSNVGRTVAQRLFQDFSGIWKVAQIESNVPAQIFWRKTIEQFTNGNYEEIRQEDWDGPIQTFSTVDQ